MPTDSDHDGNSPSDPDLLTALTNAGWLLEQTVAHVLADADCHPRLGWAFQDVDDPNKSRELDVYGYRQVLRDEDAQVIVATKFLVECKQSTMPYVAVGRTLPAWQFKRQPTQHKIPVEELRFKIPDSKSSRLKPAWEVLGFADIARQCGEDYFRATQLTRLERESANWSATNNGIFTSLVHPLAKAIRAAQRDYKGLANFSSVGKRKRFVYFDLIFPVVVTSAEIIVVDTTSREPVVLRPKWTTARRQLETESIKGVFDFDVVNEASFSECVADRLGFADAIAAAVASDPLRYTGETWEPPMLEASDL
ncbi:hypothetical protein [Lolliginicoccus suaedae]|uniref:hypothetical protein n=1 Tax=Lolliginicoccus suaedae TaxID=2605429 RepID=UPI0011F028BF|nr:hypothetical protein [Lolliginicoccus suaedae]